MKTISIKTSELSEAALDYAVALAGNIVKQYYCTRGIVENVKRYHPSTNWQQGGPIIEREGIGHYETTGWIEGEYKKHSMAFIGNVTDPWSVEYGKTLLIAAMRCYVASKLGDSVDVPSELVS